MYQYYDLNACFVSLLCCHRVMARKGRTKVYDVMFVFHVPRRKKKMDRDPFIFE